MVLHANHELFSLFYKVWYWYKTTLSHVFQIGVFKFCLEVSKACDVSWESMMPNELKDKGWKKKEEAIYKSAWLHWFFMRSCVSLIFYSVTPYSDIIRAICIFPTGWCWTPPLFCHLCLSPSLGWCCTLVLKAIYAASIAASPSLTEGEQVFPILSTLFRSQIIRQISCCCRFVFIFFSVLPCMCTSVL